MTNKIFGGFVRTALAVAMLASSQLALADVIAGSKIVLSNGFGNDAVNDGGGAFIGNLAAGSIFSGPNNNNSFQTFCVEYKEHISLGTTYYVQGVTDHTVSAIAAPATGTTPSQNGDVISSQTAWLFTQFSNTGLSSSIWGTNKTQDQKNSALQRAIWFFEDEVGSRAAPSIVSDTLEASYVALANAAVTTGGWNGIGNVRVLNLFSSRSGIADNYTYSGNAQDQLYMISAVPETETYAMMLAGLGLMGTIARRRKNKAA